jgi:hypothetical protein
MIAQSNGCPGGFERKIIPFSEGFCVEGILISMGIAAYQSRMGRMRGA